MKSKSVEKNIDEASAFSHLLKEVEKEKKRARIAYITGGSLLVLALIAFLMFGPFRVPVLSQMGDKILNRDNDVEIETVEEENTEVTSPDTTSAPTTTTESNTSSTPDTTSTPDTSTKATTPTKTATPAPTPTPTPTPTPEPEVPKCTDSQKSDYENKFCYNMYYMGYYVFSAEYYNSLVEDCPNEIYTDYPTCVSYYQSESNRTGDLSDTYYTNAMKYRALLVGCEYSESYLDDGYWDCYYEGYDAAIASFGL